jgi:nicotinamide-nucleotide amidase
MFPPDILALSEKIIREFSAVGLMVSTAESCTRGLKAAAFKKY